MRTTSAGPMALAHGWFALGVMGHGFVFCSCQPFLGTTPVPEGRGAGRGVYGLCPWGGLGSCPHGRLRTGAGLCATCRDPSVPSAPFVACAPSPSCPPPPASSRAITLTCTQYMLDSALRKHPPSASASASAGHGSGACALSDDAGRSLRRAHHSLRARLPACLLNPVPGHRTADRPPCELGG